MKQIVLTAKRRDTLGKGAAHRLRAGGSIPGVVYGPETASFSVLVNTRELSGLLRREGHTSMLMDLELDGAQEGRKVIIRELQLHPVTGAFTHVDLYQVSLKRKVHIMVPVRLTGLAEGVKSAGGIMEQVAREIEIACLPGDIPERLEIDVTPLGIGDSVHVRDIKVANVEIITDLDQTVATVVPPTIIKAAAPTAAELEAAAAAEGAPAEGAEGAPAEGAEGAAPAKEGGKEAAPAKDAKGGAPAKGAAPAKEGKGGKKEGK